MPRNERTTKKQPAKNVVIQPSKRHIVSTSGNESHMGKEIFTVNCVQSNDRNLYQRKKALQQATLNLEEANQTAKQRKSNTQTLNNGTVKRIAGPCVIVKANKKETHVNGTKTTNKRGKVIAGYETKSKGKLSPYQKKPKTYIERPSRRTQKESSVDTKPGVEKVKIIGADSYSSNQIKQKLFIGKNVMDTNYNIPEKKPIEHKKDYSNKGTRSRVATVEQTIPVRGPVSRNEQIQKQQKPKFKRVQKNWETETPKKKVNPQKNHSRRVKIPNNQLQQYQKDSNQIDEKYQNINVDENKNEDQNENEVPINFIHEHNELPNNEELNEIMNSPNEEDQCDNTKETPEIETVSLNDTNSISNSFDSNDEVQSDQDDEESQCDEYEDEDEYDVEEQDPNETPEIETVSLNDTNSISNSFDSEEYEYYEYECECEGECTCEFEEE